MGFDPSVYIEYVTDPDDPDYEIGFRAYGYWGFQRSLAAQLDQKTMYSVRPGTDVIPYFMPAGRRNGMVRDSISYPHIYPGKILEHLTSLRLLPSVRSGISMSRFTADIPDANMDWA